MYGGVWPITESGQPVAQVTLGGYSWDLYTGWNRAWNPPMRVYSFLPRNGAVQSFNADLKIFFNYLVSSQSFPASEQYLLSVSSLNA